MTFPNKLNQFANLIHFVKFILHFDNVKNIIDFFKTDCERGFAFERLFDILIKLGFCDEFPNNKFINLIGNMNNISHHHLSEISDLKSYFENTKVISGNSSGASDIHLKSKFTDEYIFMTSKYINSINSIHDLDIQNIESALDKSLIPDYKIYTLVKNKYEIIRKSNNSNVSSKYISRHLIEDKILDLNDLNGYFLEFKKFCYNSRTKEGKYDLSKLFSIDKEILKLRFHQELIVKETLNLIHKEHKQFLWGCKCRSGKTFMAGGLIRELSLTNDNLNILIITPVPTETISQFTDDLFYKFIDFKDFMIYNQRNISHFKMQNNKNIFILSKQYLQKYIGENKKLDVIFDLLFFDENHFSGTTDLSKVILNTYKSHDTKVIYLTATFNKPLKEWNISERCRIYWDIEDEQICKRVYNDPKNIQESYKRHNKEDIKYILNNKNPFQIKEMFKVYLTMPDLHLITNLFNIEKYNTLMLNMNKESKHGFCFETLFSLNKNKTQFINKNEIKTFLSYISGSNKVSTNDTKTIFSRIDKLVAENESRTPFTQTWFLPSNNINEISKELIKLIKEDSILQNYNVIPINRKNSELAINVKENIITAEQLAKLQGKKGLILLAGSMLSLGITLENCDVIMLLNNSNSCDKIFQQMYRCMTEAQDKKIGIVVDMNTNRVLNTCLNYSLNSLKNTSQEEQIKYLIDYHLINIDKDLFTSSFIDNQVITKKLLEVWKAHPINNIKNLLRRLDEEYIEFDNQTQKELNKFFNKTLKDENISVTLTLHKNQQEINSGIEVIREKKESNNKQKEIEELKISFTKDVLHYIIPLVCFLNRKENNNDLVYLLENIKHNSELLDIFNEQCSIWWGKTYPEKTVLINFIKDKVSEKFNKKSNVYNISIQIKMSLESLIDNPKELLEFINDSLKPKTIEKKKFGEVFTPMSLVNEMLDTLPKEVWSNKDLKWFDPASGMGNFPIAVYLRLMESLKPVIKDEKKRKKHILENMLYMSELNKKNVFITKEIFDINSEYRLNLHCGDSLTLDTVETFGVKEFDIVLGNPPYNKNNTNTGNSLWDKFVKMSLNNLLKKNGYLLFIHPATWRKPESTKSKLKGLFSLMTQENYLIKLNINDSTNGIKTFNCGTRYDIYLIQRIKPVNKKTSIIDEKDYKIELNLKNYKFLPNCNFELFNRLVDFNKKDVLDILNDFSYSRLNKKITSNSKSDIFKYPLVYLTPKNGIRLMYSNVNNLGHFGISKVIIGETGLDSAINDYMGEYGMTQDSFAILIETKEEGDNILKAIKTSKFKEFMKYSCSWSNFRIEWRLFCYIKKDFWKEFI